MVDVFSQNKGSITARTYIKFYITKTMAHSPHRLHALY